MKKSNAYQPTLIESLRDAREAEQYLNAALEEDDPELFLLALRNVAEAQEGVAQLAEKTKLNRESLYKMLSERGNPELKSIDVLLHAMGFRLAVAMNRETQIKERPALEAAGERVPRSRHPRFILEMDGRKAAREREATVAAFGKLCPASFGD